ncbi:MAG: PEP/pyruvate-binding domain-containing protein, partial [Microlunatus sp.]
MDKPMIYRFSAEHCDWTSTDPGMTKTVLGGKGAGLVMMAQNGFSVPPGMTIPTTVCNHYATLSPTGKAALVSDILVQVMDGMEWLRDKFGYMPLVSVRSGAPVSMPGMLDTILNVGMYGDVFPDWANRIGERAAADSMRRLIQMLGSTAFGVPHGAFEQVLAEAKSAAGIEHDHQMGVAELYELHNRYLAVFEAHTGKPFPMTLEGQLGAAIAAVFDSWNNPRAIEYRKLNNIDPAMGTACTVQAMVFGNMGDDSGTGVLFTRNPSTGENVMTGEFLQNAQGEDVVAGIRTPVNVDQMEDVSEQWADIYLQLLKTCGKLEKAYADMVDIEFTVQQGELFILQSRTGKRSARAAFRIAVDLVEQGVIDVPAALKRISKEQYKVARRPSVDPKFTEKPKWVGLPACPGVAVGKPVFSSLDAINCAEPCVLITHETTPEDIGGMAKAMGVLTKVGGFTSHASVVSRAMDKPCVVGCSELDMASLKAAANNGEKVTICGSTGRVWVGLTVPVVDGSEDPYVSQVEEW